MDQTIAQLRTWQPRPGPNPLPEPFEAQALRVFAQQHPMAEYGNPLFKMERDAARAIVRTNALDTIAALDWTLDTALDALTEQSIRLTFGAHEIGPELQAEVRSYASSYLEDLWPVVGRPAMTIGGMAKNASDLRMAARKVS